MRKRQVVLALGAVASAVLALTLTLATSAQASTSVLSAADTTPPTMPTGLSVTTNCSLAVSLRWDASTHDVGVVDYEVYRSANNSSFALLGTTTTTTYADRLSTIYQYQVRARDAAGNVSAFTAPVTAYIPPCPPPTSSRPPTSASTTGDQIAPTVPGTPTASISCGSATLTWAASTDNTGVVGYDIWRTAGTDGPFTALGTSTTTSFTITGVGTFQYQVRARDAAGNVSAFSAPVTVITPACPSTTGPSQGCSATYSAPSTWPGGFQGQVTVTNTGTTATTGWSVTLTFADGQKITQAWGGRLTGTGPYTVANESYNGAIAPGGSVSFGFLGTWTGTNTAPAVACARTP